jgi:acetolactate synthase-1/2/3 large subunit
LGGEIERELSREFGELLNQLDIPIMTTWNAADRIAFTNENFFGRPNTWGMRFSNVIIQQADLLIALGTRLNIQQTGFNTDSFLPLGKIVHFFSDASEFSRPIKQRVASHAMKPSEYFSTVLKVCESGQTKYSEWLEYCKEIKKALPLSEATNATHDGFWNPYDFYLELSEVLNDGDTLIPSSSGGAETVAMQAFMQREGVGIITNGSLASMGYGLAGAIGASLMRNGRVVLVEGDGGFAQNLQELGTVTAQNLNIAIFVFSNEGYASIRTTQRSYFGGHYVGCDSSTGLGLPDWSQLFPAFGIEASVLEPTVSLRELLSEQNDLPRAFIVPIHPEQSYFPKITSRVLTNGSMESNPLHMMTPPLDGATSDRVMKYLYL